MCYVKNTSEMKFSHTYIVDGYLCAKIYMMRHNYNNDEVIIYKVTVYLRCYDGCDNDFKDKPFMGYDYQDKLFTSLIMLIMIGVFTISFWV